MRPAGPKCSDRAPSGDPVADHPPHLVERGDPFDAEPQAVLAKRRHALLNGRSGELLRRALDRGSHPALDRQSLVDSDPTAVPGAGALEAAGGSVEGAAGTV